MACAELLIAKELFNHPLAVIEATLNGNRMNILAQGCHLALLERANLALGEENCNVHTLNSPEALGNCAACISGGCHTYIYPLLFICKPSQHLSHKAGANILEGKSWPVKKFKRVERRSREALLQGSSGARARCGGERCWRRCGGERC